MGSNFMYPAVMYAVAFIWIGRKIKVWISSKKKGNTNQTEVGVSMSHLSCDIMEVDGIGNLSRDLIICILSRLPMKVVCKFRCVSKQWLNIISDPYFMNLHFDHSKRNPLLLFSRIQRGGRIKNTVVHLATMDMKGTDHTDRKVVVDDTIYQLIPSSGLILLEGLHYIYVCNPSIGEFIRLLDAARSPGWVPYYGFGYLPSTNEYKIVRLFRRTDDNNDYRIPCEIYSLQNGGVCSCSSLEISSPFKILDNCSSVYANGVIYWIIWHINDNGLLREAILSLDMEEEIFRIFDHPPLMGRFKASSKHLVELKGVLCLVINFSETSTVDIWMLKDFKNGVWEKEYRINVSSLDDGTFGDDDESTIIFPVDIRNGEILMVMEHRSTFHYYNIENKSFRTADFSREQPDTMPFIVFESFFSL